ncbi:MAG TPA: cell division protein FtsQ/DivIB, partial [Steroidobacteraceae bacterium]|nr:cell division protein FtsQ/DivIB [Steroidobacteraceae bacterium]
TAASTGGVVVRLGRQDVEERLNRFIVAASPLVATRAGEVNYVDMRYSNGFAVGWMRGDASLANKPNAKGSTPDA